LLRRAPLLALLLVVGCDNPTASPRTIELSITGPESLQIRPSRYPNDDWRVECDVDLVLSARGGGKDASASWTGGTLQWHRASDGVVTTTDRLTSAEAAEFWGPRQVRTGEEHISSWSFWDAEPFRLSLEFTYRTAPGSEEKRTEYTVRCEPPAPPLSGRYALRTINDRPLPAPSGSWHEVHYDTLTFFPNLTYTQNNRVLGSELYEHNSFPVPYQVLSDDSVFLPLYGGAVYRSATGLTFVERGCCGRPDYVWRFEKVWGPAHAVRDGRGAELGGHGGLRPK
jgi:hypothetical protein